MPGTTSAASPVDGLKAAQLKAALEVPVGGAVRSAPGPTVDQVTLPDGTTGYTRDGSFQLDNQGRVVTSSGLQVQGGITVPANALNISIAQDGTVSATIPGTTAPQSIGTITMASFVNPAGLEPKGQNIFGETVASGQPNAGTPGQNGLGALMQGFVETSNVNVVQELVTMIQTQRAYEMNSKAIQTSDQMLQKLGQL